MIANSILDLVGNTPLVKLNKMFTQQQVYVKLEGQNPGGSIKDRVALAMIKEAEKRGDLKPNSIIIEPTSGNTGIGLAMFGAVLGYKVILVMPETMSVERRKTMTIYGADIILTDGALGMKGAIDKASEIVNNNNNYWMPMQFNNADNPNIHTKTTALEIINNFPDGLDYLVAGVGTGGHISGIASVLKQHFPAIKVIAVEPQSSAVISGEAPGKHQIQGIGAGFIPNNLNVDIIDEVIKVDSPEALQMVGDLAKTEGLFLGISTAASVVAINKANLPKGAKVLFLSYDRGDRYISVL